MLHRHGFCGHVKPAASVCDRLVGGTCTPRKFTQWASDVQCGAKVTVHTAVAWFPSASLVSSTFFIHVKVARVLASVLDPCAPMTFASDGLCFSDSDDSDGACLHDVLG
jgi:hypothetical protein